MKKIALALAAATLISAPVVAQSVTVASAPRDPDAVNIYADVTEVCGFGRIKTTQREMIVNKARRLATQLQKEGKKTNVIVISTGTVLSSYALNGNTGRSIIPFNFSC